MGRNTANNLGIDKNTIVLWDRTLDDGGLTTSEIATSRIILWDDFCSVHCRFNPSQIEALGERIPDIKVIVHPECPEKVVNAADFSGSTSQIIQTFTAAEPGSN